ncbi:AbrB family transcriptional regulator [Rhodoligotrophos ferricapiens]|uniref:AbrB family transcriptional regulator n=1 Tax=Rhodoligotrophos ferricapiens TaxID=3069264 RepID=UPI00315C7820
MPADLSKFLQSKLFRVLATIAVAAAGGSLFAFFNLPAPWLAGAMVATMVLCLSGFRGEVPKLASPAVFVLLGLSIGSSVDWETLSLMRSWPTSLAILAVTMIAVTFALQAYYRRAYGWDDRTSFFAAVPGALSSVVIFAVEYRADVLRVTVVQCIRLAFLVAFLPLVITWLAVPSGAAMEMPKATHSLQDLIIVIAAGALGAWLFQRLRMPAGILLGAAAANIALHLGGIVEGGLPPWLLEPAYVVLGAVIGARFSGMTLGMVRQSAGAGIKGCLLASVIGVIGATTTSWVTGLPYPETLLAFAPGGLDAMSIMAFALGLDPAYVAAHQVFRFLMMTLAMPLVSLWLGSPERSRAKSPAADESGS